MGYMSYRGPADVVFTTGEGEVEMPGLLVLFEQTHTATFALMFADRSERLTCSHVRIILPDGHLEYGPVTYSKYGVLVFNTGDEWGRPREQS
jgi:hypothetical protein